MYETKRLILRNWQDSDIPEFIAMNQDPRVMEFFPALYTVEETLASIAKFKQSIDQRGYGMFACELKENGKFIGFVGLMYRDFKASFTPCVEIGWRIAYPYWGQGFAVEAAHKCLDLGFNQFHLDEVVSFTSALNKRSERIMQKLGMQREPLHDFYHPKLDRNHPLAKHIFYRLTKSDFLHKQTSANKLIDTGYGNPKIKQYNVIKQLEEMLLMPDIRKSRTKMDNLLADDFIEYSSSGIISNKESTINELQLEATVKIIAKNFHVQELAFNVILVTYIAVKYNKLNVEESSSLRSSIWKLNNNNWQMIFHQGTKIHDM